MADVLSQSEVASLLAALDPGSSVSSAPTTQRQADGLHGQISVYDFKRPQCVSKEQMRAFQALHEGFSREFGAGLSGMLRTTVETKLIGIDQLTYSEFVFSLENPTCFNLLHSEGLDGHLVLALNPSIIFPAVDRLLGGGREPRQSPPNRPLTEIELRLVSRITGLAIRGLESAWANICPLSLRVTQIESNPQLVQIVPPNEVVILVSFEITMGEMRGIMNLCIPVSTLEPLTGKLSSETWSADAKRVPDPRQRLNLETGISQPKVELVVCLARTRLTAGEITNLAVGDVIMTETESTAGLEVLIEDRPLFLGHPGLYRDHKAVRVGKAITRPQEIIGAGPNLLD